MDRASQTKDSSCACFLLLWYLQQLLEEHDDQFDHLLVFLTNFFLWHLQNFVHVQNHCFDHFWRQEVFLVDMELSEQIEFDPSITVAMRQLSQLHEQHHAQKGQLLVLCVENEQRQEVFLQEVPPA